MRALSSLAPLLLCATLLASVGAISLASASEEEFLAITVSGVELSVFEEHPGNELKLKSKEKIDKSPTVFDPAVHLHETSEIRLSLEVGGVGSGDLKPQQRLLTLTHAERPAKAARVVGDVKGHETKAGTLVVTFTVTVDSIEGQIGTLNGEYDAQVVVADSRFATQYEATFGRVVVSHTQNDDGSLPSDPPLDAAEIEYAPRPEFEHIMREDVKRPPAMVSMVFAGAVICPLGLLLLLVAASGANLKRLGSVFPQALVFHAALAAVLAVVVYYWVELPFLKTLPVLSGVGVGAALSGYFLLNKLIKLD